jgi:hypothetical protein
MIFEPVVHLAQTVHQSCTDTNTISRRTKTTFHMTHVTLAFHLLCPKLFLSLWYIRRKPHTYVALTQTMSPNRLKRDSI